ncbi:TRAP transporter large permease [Frigidibacter sp. MR17.24]|uniref:TRAP transporter large permease n=1 Tax=Frigidibacter sp. MR17.24 TaxID=3127345 RepID=UPI003012F6CA
MIEILTHNMAPLMLVALIFLLMSGYPVAFGLSATGLLFAVIGIELGMFGENFLRALPDRILGVMANETLLAIPFFTFMGIVLQRSRMAEDLIDTIAQLLGSLRGGVAYAVLFVGALLAATTGVVAASVISIALIALPVMLRYGYDRRLASGIIMASGTLAQTIPPSIILIVLADQFGRSVGDVYRGAMVPALLLVVLYGLYIFVLTRLRPEAAPAVPPEAQHLREPDGRLGLPSLLACLAGLALGIAGAVLALGWLVPQMRTIDAQVYGTGLAVLGCYLFAQANGRLKLNLLSRMAEAVIVSLIPPLALIFLVLGTILLGIATPTEGGAMGAVGALILAGSKGRLDWPALKDSVQQTAQLATFVIFVLIGSRVFALTFYGLNGHVWVEELLLAMPGGVIGFLVFTNLLVFVLGFFLDFFEIAFILIPLVAPAAETLGIDLIWYAVMLAVNLQAAYLTPPFGFALFFLRSVAPRDDYEDRVTGRSIAGVSTAEIYRAGLAFVALQVVMIGLLIAFPQMVLHYKGPAVDAADVKIDIPIGDDPFGPTLGF